MALRVACRKRRRMTKRVCVRGRRKMIKRERKRRICCCLGLGASFFTHARPEASSSTSSKSLIMEGTYVHPVSQPKQQQACLLTQKQ